MDNITSSIRRVATVSANEIGRPIKSKTTPAAILVLLFTIAAGMALSAPPAAETVFPASINLYRVAVQGDAGLSERIGWDPRYEITHDDPDLILFVDDYAVSVNKADSAKARNAEAELKGLIRGVNQDLRDRYLQLHPGDRYALYPLLVKENALIPEAGGETVSRGGASTGARGERAPVVRRNVGGPWSTQANTQYALPDELVIPLPLEPIIIYLIAFTPILFFATYTSHTFLREKTGKTGTLLHTTPLRGWEIILGKTLPYLILALASSAALGAFEGIPVLPLIAAYAPAAFLCFGATTLTVLLSKSTQDVNTANAFVFMLLLAFFFYPLLFMGIFGTHVISPVGALIEYIKQSTSAVQYLMQLLPTALAGFVLFAVCAQVIKNETLYGNEAMVYKVSTLYEALERRTNASYAILLGSMASIPLVYLIESFMVVTSQMGGRQALAPVILVSALIEEAAKILPVAALTRCGKINPGLKHLIIAALGYYLGERIITAGFLLANPPPLDPLLLIAMFALPLIGHVIPTSISVLGVRMEKGRFTVKMLVYLLFAAAIHFAYNMGVLSLT